MDTKSIDGLIQPRVYQLYGDQIDSKQAMEPLAISAGPGPLCGFDYLTIDTENNRVSITGYNKEGIDLTHLDRSIKSTVIGHSKLTVLSDKTNTAGLVNNAYISRDGLLHIVNEVNLDFTPSNGWPNLKYPQNSVVFALKVKHTYIDQVHNYDPTESDWSIVEISDFNNISGGLERLMSLSYGEALDSLTGNGLLDLNTEVLIGLYIIGWSPAWGNFNEVRTYKPVMNMIGNRLSLVYYGAKRSTLMDILSNQVIVSELEAHRSNTTGYLSMDIQNNVPSIKLQYLDKVGEVDPTHIRLDTSDIREDGSGHFVIVILDHYGILSKVDLNTLMINAIEDAFISNTRPRAEFIQVYTEKIPTDLPPLYYYKYHFMFWVDPGFNNITTTGGGVKIRGIAKINL